MQRIRVTYAASQDDESTRPSTYVMKQTKNSAASAAQSQQMGLVREALFYKFVEEEVRSVYVYDTVAHEYIGHLCVKSAFFICARAFA